MKIYRFNGKCYGGGKSSGFLGLGWMVYDIIKDWADKNRPASFGELTAKFPQTLRGSSGRAKDALFASKDAAQSRSLPRHVHKNRRFLVIRTGDGLEYAVSKEWGDLHGNAGDIVVFVEHAIGMGYDIEVVADEVRRINERENNGSEATKRKTMRGHQKFAKGRYRVTALGDAQNIFVRHILGSLGDESFSGGDWEETKAHFGGKCAYCDKDAELQRDHIVPINRKAMGEHRLGNLVPSCRTCNTAKGDKNYRDWEFLADNPAARRRIEEYMQSRNYSPISDREDAAQARELLEEAYRAIEPLAEEYIRKLNDLLG